MAHIRYQNITKRFGSVVALEALNLEIYDKEFITLVGPSGCGKSTTLNITAGLEDPSGGELYIDDRLVNAVPPGERDIAMVFQSYALYPHKTVRENIGFGLKVRKLKHEEIERRVQEAARILDIESLLDRKPRELSGGQRQRVALGRAITRDPKVFLLDEPLSNLDAQLRVQMRAELKLLFDRIQGTVLYVTHDQAEAMTMSDRVVVMNHGVVQQVGTPLEVYNLPNNQFVAGFLGSPSMNFVPCTVAQNANALTVDIDGASFAIDLGATPEAPTDDATSHRRLAQKQTQLQGAQILGIRPEDIELVATPPTQTEALISGEIILVEHMGSSNIYFIRVGKHRLLATTEADRIFAPNTNVHLRLNTDKLHFFHPENGENLTVG